MKESALEEVIGLFTWLRSTIGRPNIAAFYYSRRVQNPTEKASGAAYTDKAFSFDDRIRNTLLSLPNKLSTADHFSNSNPTLASGIRLRFTGCNLE